MTVRVGVNGYGTIGKRVAEAIAKQPDMTLVGVAKTRPSFEARSAIEKGFPLYVTGGGKIEEFQQVGLPVAGPIEEMLRNVDVIVDAAPERVGAENLKLYDAAKVRAILQGGEKAESAEVSFNALGNYGAARGKRRVRVVSCNTTGIARAAAVLDANWGIDHWEVTIIRRGADPPEVKKGPINGILPTFKLPSHHGPDVQTIFPKLRIATMAAVVPTTLMHVHVNYVRLARAPGGEQEVLDTFRKTPRFRIFSEWEHVDGTPQVMEFAKDRAKGFPDMMENVLWEKGLKLDGKDAYFFQAIHQESIVIPENIDAIRAMCELAVDAKTSMAITDKSLGLRP
jgi:glyceraldehyde-3-phosphate dehydrogenase (NAD(P))